MKDELTENKKGIIDTGTVFYIEDPFAREETIAYINSRLGYLSEGKWRVDYANYWCQDNTSDCGLHTIVAMFIHFTGATRSKFHTDDAKCNEAISTMRSMLLNFIRYKYVTKSKEIFDPYLVINLMHWNRLYIFCFIDLNFNKKSIAM